MANYDSNYAIAQEISARIGTKPVPFDSVYSICQEIYHQLGGIETGFDSVYSILLAILPLVEGGSAEVEKLLRLIELMNSTGAYVETTSVNSIVVCVHNETNKGNVSAVVWGDGTFTETDGEVIINGDSDNTTISLGLQNYYCLTHTYTTQGSKKIKIIGTHFYDTFDTDNGIGAYVKSISFDKGVQYMFAIVAGQNNVEYIKFDDECTTNIGDMGLAYSNAHIKDLYLPKGLTYGRFSLGNLVVENFLYGDSSALTVIPRQYNYISGSYSRYGVTELNLPKHITTIEQTAFGIQSPYYNGELQKVNFPSTLTTLGDNAFSYAFANNATIDLPSSVASIGSRAFSRGYYYENNTQHICKYTMISHAAVPPTAQSNSFDAVDYIKPTDCVLYVPNDSIAAYSEATGWKEFGTILPIESMGFEVATNAEIEQMF